MHKKDCFYLGKIIKKHSFKGEVIIKLDTDQPELYSNLESVFVELGNNLIPFFIEKSSLTKKTMLKVKFENICSEGQADAIIKSNLYLPIELLPKLSGNKFYYHEVIGYKVVDLNFGNVGVIVSINDATSQPLFEISYNKIKVFIPAIDQFIKKVDRENKTIKVQTPEGLIDLYLK